MRITKSGHLSLGLLAFILIGYQNCGLQMAMKAANYNAIEQSSVGGSKLRTDVFELLKDPLHEAFPAVIKLGNGDLLAVFRQGHQHETSSAVASVMQIVSKDQGRSWSAPVTIYSDSDFDSAPGSNLIRLDNGHLLLGVQRRNLKNSNLDSTIVLRSIDQGLTWVYSAPIQPYGVPFGRMVQLPDASVIMPAYGYVVGGGALYRSFDDGITWSLQSSIIANDMSLPFGQEGWTSFTETSILPITDRRWIGVIRGNTYGPSLWLNKLYITYSMDAGKSWTSPTFLFEGASPDLIRMQDSRILLCLSSRDASAGPVGVRCHTSIDGGESWTKGKMLGVEVGGATDCGYPYPVQLDRGRYFSIFYMGGYGRPVKDTDLFGVYFDQNMM